jgi:hypothetical protein
VTSESGSIVLGWLTRITVVLAALGLVGFELLSVAVTRVSAHDIAVQSADAAQSSWAGAKNPALDYQAAAASAESSGASIPRRSFVVNSDGSMRFVVDKTATTLVLYRIGPLAHLAHIRYTYVAQSLESTGATP